MRRRIVLNPGISGCLVLVATILSLVAPSGCAVPRVVYLDEVYTTTIVAESISRTGEPVSRTRELFEGRSSFFVHSTLTDLRPGKTYTFSLEIKDQQGRNVLPLIQREFIATETFYKVWRRVEPDWEIHGPGRWEISAGVGSQLRHTDLFVLSRYVKHRPRKAENASADRVQLDVGMARSAGGECQLATSKRPNQVNMKLEGLHVCVDMKGLEEAREYRFRMRVLDPLGRTTLEINQLYLAKKSEATEFRPLEFGLFAEPGVWTTEVELGSNRTRATFEVVR